ncbi:hypothetical protein ACHAPD_005743 [Fusarium lateritium]
MTTTTEVTTTTGCNSVDPLRKVALTYPTPVFDDDLDHDDDSATITLPFSFNGQNTVYISSNGILSVSTEYDSVSKEQLSTNSIAAISYCVYWDDLYVSLAAGNTIVYEVYTDADGQVAVFEWIVGKGGNEVYHFSIMVYEDASTEATFYYYTPPQKEQSVTTISLVVDGTLVTINLDARTVGRGAFDNTECRKGVDDNPG